MHDNRTEARREEKYTIVRCSKHEEVQYHWRADCGKLEMYTKTLKLPLK